MKKLLFVLLLVSTSANAEKIELTCTLDEYLINLTIDATSNKKAKIYINDRDMESSSEKGIGSIQSFSITNSEIKFDTSFENFKITNPNGTVIEAGSVNDSYIIYRTDGKITKLTKLQGWWRLMSKNASGIEFLEGKCVKRIPNKF